MKLFRKLHLWLSFPFGIIIALVCFSGAMLVFEQEITRLIQKDVYYAKSIGDAPLPVELLAEIAMSTIPDSVSVTGITVFSDKRRTCQINLSKPRRAALYIDRYTGEITGRTERPHFFTTMFRLHRWLLDSADPRGTGPKTGKLLVGISTLMFVVALITGSVIWIPRARKNFHRSLCITFREGRRGFWRGLHVAGGMYALIILLAMSLTGLTWSFEWYRNGFYALCGAEQTARKESRGDRHGDDRAARDKKPRNHARVHWQKVYDEVSALNPDSPQITLSKGVASVSLATGGNGRAADRYLFREDTGEIVSVSRYADSARSDKLRGWIYAIHTGSWGGIVTRILWFLSALLGAALPLTGYYLWFTRIHRNIR